jgi:hypothetical protein
MKTIISTLILTLVFGSFNFVSARTKQQVKVLINRQKAVPGSKLTIKFASLVEDAPCPVDTNCIDAGNAKITIKVSKSNGAAQTFELNTNSAPQSVTFAGYKINLVALNPGPATNIRINRNGYTATFIVSKSGSSK